MNIIFRTAAVVIGLIFSFYSLLYLFVAVGLGSGPDSSVLGRALACILVSLPFLFSFWIVYRGFCASEMARREIFTREVRPKALLRAVMAELCMLLVAFLLGKVYEFHTRDFPVLVERAASAGRNTGHRLSASFAAFQPGRGNRSARRKIHPHAILGLAASCLGV